VVGRSVGLRVVGRSVGLVVVGRGVGLGAIVGRGTGIREGEGVTSSCATTGANVGQGVGRNVGAWVGDKGWALHFFGPHLLFPRVVAQSVSEQQKLFVLPLLAQIEHCLRVHSLAVLQIF
jgi:hypothetical protein